jgi:hypothetical protein
MYKKPSEVAVLTDLYKPKKGKYRRQTAVRCIKPWRGKYRPQCR